MKYNRNEHENTIKISKSNNKEWRDGTLRSYYFDEKSDNLYNFFAKKLKMKEFPPEPLLSNVKRIINSLEKNKVILGMGEVQSGKTLLLTVLIAWLFKRNMFDLVLFFTDKN